MPKCMRAEARALLSWCLEQRGPFSRMDASKSLERDPASVAEQFRRFEMLGLLESEIDAKGRYSYMILNRQLAKEAAEQQPMSASAIERQRRSRLKTKRQPKPIVNSVWGLAL